MTVILLSLAVVTLLVLMMSVGVIFGRKPISGSCGGMAAVGLKSDCDICGGDRNKCESNRQQVNQDTQGLAYDAADTTKRSAK